MLISERPRCRSRFKVMILTKEQSDSRLSSPENVSNKIKSLPLVIHKDGKNRVGRPGSTNLTEEEKVAIGYLANVVGNENASEIMRVSENTARHLRSAQKTESEGQGTQRYEQDQELKKKIEDRLSATRLTIEERAAEKLLGAMGLITEEKLENSSAKDLAQITNQMSQVVRNISGNGSNNNSKGRSAKVQIVVHQPRAFKEDHFDVIEVGIGE